MRDDLSCDEVRGLAPELALGIAAGEERARALHHLAACSECRRHVDDLSAVADDLLLLTPTHEPPVGFESRVADRISGESRRPGWRRGLPAAIAAVLAATAALVVMYTVTGEERESAAHYREALEQADGKYFGVEPLRDTDGRRAGHVFTYEGSPSWVFVVVTGPAETGTWAVELVTRDRTRVALGSLHVTDGEGTFGAGLPVKLRDVARIQVVEEDGDGLLRAEVRSSESSPSG
jgi:hypothetical protein